RFYIPNKFTRSAIESLLARGGGIPETSFHKSHLVIRFQDLQGSVSIDDDEFLYKLKEKVIEDGKASDELKAFFQEELEDNGDIKRDFGTFLYEIGKEVSVSLIVAA